ncbi:MAG TPA: hypothetical protein VH442_08080 [Micromonosporaceae bacterium]
MTDAPAPEPARPAGSVRPGNDVQVPYAPSPNGTRFAHAAAPGAPYRHADTAPLPDQPPPDQPPAGESPPDQPPPGWPRVPPPWRGGPSSVPPWHGSGPPAGVPGIGRPPRLIPPRSHRPIYREPFAARPGAVVIGAAAGALWMLLFGLLGHNVRTYCWWSIGAAIAAWGASAVVARSGDRGVAAGVALSAGVGLAIVASVIISRWAGGHWPLW